MTVGDRRRAAIADVVDRVPQLRQLLAENLLENFGDLIPTLFIADLLPWMVEHVESEPDSVQKVLNWMEELLQSNDPMVRGLILVSGIDDATSPGGVGEAMRPLLGPRTASIDPWSTSEYVGVTLHPNGVGKSKPSFHIRVLSPEEVRIVTRLIEMSGLDSLKEGVDLSTIPVIPMDDGGMGSLRFWPKSHSARMGSQISQLDFTDTDGIPVSVALNLDQTGHLFELDVFKADFSPLIEYPAL